MAPPGVWFARALREPGFEEWPITAEIAIAAYEQPEPFHKNPADRLIVATARLLDAPSGHRRPGISGLRLGHVRTMDRAGDRATVRAFYQAALAAGATDNGQPGVPAEYHPNYYGAFVLHPHGHNIEAVCHAPE